MKSYGIKSVTSTPNYNLRESWFYRYRTLPIITKETNYMTMNIGNSVTKKTIFIYVKKRPQSTGKKCMEIFKKS